MSPLPLTLESEGLGDGIMVNGELMAEMGNSAAPVGVSASAGGGVTAPRLSVHTTDRAGTPDGGRLCEAA